ncbi:MAG: transcriptional regulator BetI [Methanomassiliicoccales archaeon PtaB.Bin215]|nr:MAG: transcriptional regulator BetI [Methanomassiliicoccales archaeon PtaB.Bin215]
MPKIMPEYREEVRRRIVEAGFDAMCEKGYAQTTMDDVADRLGVSKPALYRYFKNKDDLIIESSKNFSRLFAEKARTLPPASGPLDGWNVLFDLYMDHDDRVFALYFELLAMTQRDPEIKKNAVENLKEGFDHSKLKAELYKKKGLISESSDPYTVALATMSLFLGMRALVLLGIDRAEIRKRWTDIGRMVYGLHD